MSATFTHLTSIDFDHFATLDTLQMEGKSDLVAEVIQIFMETSPDQLAHIHEAFQKQERERLRREAHGFKSTCYTVGARVLAEICQHIENLSQTGGSWDGIRKEVESLKSECECAKSELSAFLIKRKGEGHGYRISYRG